MSLKGKNKKLTIMKKLLSYILTVAVTIGVCSLFFGKKNGSSIGTTTTDSWTPSTESFYEATSEETEMPESASATGSRDGSSYGAAMIPCPICSPRYMARGNGRCKTCGGYGCDDCRGSGTCFWCNGRGEIEKVGKETDYRDLCKMFHPIDLEPEWWGIDTGCIFPPVGPPYKDCPDCLGTGWVPQSYHVVADVGYNNTRCNWQLINSNHVCDNINCQQCHKYHCGDMQHVQCKRCFGTR